VTCSRSFGVLVESLGELREAVAVYVTKAAERLRRSRLAAGVVPVFITTSRFGAAPARGRWETKFPRRSQRYTTRLDEILKVA
jgi:hypothetical protein